MRLDLTTLLLGALSLPLTAADRLEVWQICSVGAITCSQSTGIFFTSAGSYGIVTADGCRKPNNVPGMTEICMDWGKNRGHFKFSHQSNKRCLLYAGREANDGCPSDKWTQCWKHFFNEGACSWREENPGNATEPVAEVSEVAAAELPQTTLVEVVKKSEE